MLLNELILEDLVDDKKVSVVTVSNTIRGRRRNKEVMKALSDRVGISVERLFPDSGTMTHKIPDCPAESSINGKSTSVM